MKFYPETNRQLQTGCSTDWFSSKVHWFDFQMLWVLSGFVLRWFWYIFYHDQGDFLERLHTYLLMEIFIAWSVIISKETKTFCYLGRNPILTGVGMAGVWIGLRWKHSWPDQIKGLWMWFIISLAAFQMLQHVYCVYIYIHLVSALPWGLTVQVQLYGGAAGVQQGGGREGWEGFAVGFDCAARVQLEGGAGVQQGGEGFAVG